MKKKVFALILSFILSVCMFGCGNSPKSVTNDRLNTNTTQATNASAKVIANQPAPTDLNYSLERYNLIRRAYWVNGQREKAISLPCSVNKPLGYIILFKGNSIIGRFVVDGKVSSLSSYLFPAYEDQDADGDTAGNGAGRTTTAYNVEIPGIDGSYGSNVKGIFFFTTNGNYMEWTGDFLYSDIPFKVDDPVLKVSK